MTSRKGIQYVSTSTNHDLDNQNCLYRHVQNCTVQSQQDTMVLKNKFTRCQLQHPLNQINVKFMWHEDAVILCEARVRVGCVWDVCGMCVWVGWVWMSYVEIF